jgi:hypothetical protein
MSLWIGIDPGHTWTGLVLRDGNEIVAQRTLERAQVEGSICVGPRWFDEITHAIDIQQRTAARAIQELGRTWGGMAIEGVEAACGFRDGKKQFARPEHLMGLAATWGAIVARYPDITNVPPGGNGSELLVTYPEALITPAEKRKGLMRKALKGSKVSHCRSAFDVARKAEQMARVAA